MKEAIRAAFHALLVARGWVRDPDTLIYERPGAPEGIYYHGGAHSLVALEAGRAHNPADVAQRLFAQLDGVDRTAFMFTDGRALALHFFLAPDQDGLRRMLDAATASDASDE